MKIAQVSPLYESVPPKFYVGTERVVSYITEELVRQGHEVTLFASGDSMTSARLEANIEKALRLNPNCIDPYVHHIMMLEQVFKACYEFDIIHFHIDYLHFPLSRAFGIPNVTTLHGRLDLPDLIPIYQEFFDMPVVSISDHQRRPLSFANWQSTVYHGLPPDLYRFYPETGKYLAFIGRISPEKRVDRAIEIAIRVGLKLRIAAKVDKVDQAYFSEFIEPLLKHPLIEFVGEIGEDEKNEFLGRAYALLFPVDWPEPFVLAMIEAMACGTPVIALRCGSVPEVIDHGDSGFVVDDLEAGVEAAKNIDKLSRLRCRQIFDERFTASRMVQDYLKVYQTVIDATALMPGLRGLNVRPA